jgi:hypothetical protein
MTSALASLRYETVFCSDAIDQPSKFGGIRDEAEQALPTQAAHQARHEACRGCVLPLLIGFAADAERWIARIIYEERMSAPRIYLPVGRDHSGERVPRQLVNIAEGARHMITVGRPCEQLRQMVPVLDADPRQCASNAPPGLGSVTTVAMLL